MNIHKPVDSRFFVPRIPVAILALGDSGEALLLRALLENLGANVTLHPPGTPDDVLLVLDQGSLAPPYLIISGHGDETGFILGQFGPEIDTSALVDGSLPPSNIAARIDLPGCIVVSTACLTGTTAFANAFAQGGVSAYIAPIGYPTGTTATLFVHLLFYELFVTKSDLTTAWRRAATTTADSHQFVLAQNDGAELRISTI